MDLTRYCSLEGYCHLPNLSAGCCSLSSFGHMLYTEGRVAATDSSPPADEILGEQDVRVQSPRVTIQENLTLTNICILPRRVGILLNIVVRKGSPIRQTSLK